MSALWKPLQEELARRAADNSEVRMWLRDDDAIAPTPALDRLLELTRQYQIPVAIAAIPALTGAPLAERLIAMPHATVVVHGWKHENHAAPGQKKLELGGDRPIGEILNDLSAALGRMLELCRKSLQPMLVPPWNRIAEDVLPHLEGLGYAAVSCFGANRFKTSIPVINTHVDLIDWRGTRSCRDHAELLDALLRHVQRTERAGEPIGILAHHLDHDEAAWRFLDKLFALTRKFPICSWLSPAELIARNRKI